MHSHHSHIYKTRKHLVITTAIIIVPFLLLLAAFFFTGRDIGDFFVAASVSTLRLTAAYIISLILGWGGAILFSKGRLSDVGLPIFDVLQSFPAFAALPFAVATFGPSNTVVIIFLVIAIIWPIFFTTISSLKLVKRDWQEAALMANLSRFQYLKDFLIPVSIPGVITGSIIGLGDGWEALIATEIIVNVKYGAGAYFNGFAGQPADVTFGIFGFLIIIFLINKIIWLPLLSKSHTIMEE